MGQKKHPHMAGGIPPPFVPYAPQGPLLETRRNSAPSGTLELCILPQKPLAAQGPKGTTSSGLCKIICKDLPHSPPPHSLPETALVWKWSTDIEQRPGHS